MVCVRLVELFTSAQTTKEKESVWLDWFFLPIGTLNLKAQLESRTLRLEILGLLQRECPALQLEGAAIWRARRLRANT